MKTITSIEELDALPEGAVVREDGSQDRIWIFEKDADGAWGTPWSSSPWDVRLPATLLHPAVFDAADVHVATGVASTADPYRELHPSQAESIVRAVLGAVGSVEA